MWVRALLEMIRRFRLDDRDPQVANIRYMAEHGMISDPFARVLLLQIEPLIQAQRDSPNLLHRAPTREQLYADGPPEIEIGHLVEAPSVRAGLRVLHRVGHVLVAGATGAGKTTDLRRIVKEVYRVAKKLGLKIAVVLLDRKGGDHGDLPGELGSDFIHLSVHDGTRFGLNSPPGVPPSVWINTISTLFAARAGLVASAISLANEIRWLLDVLNPAPTQSLLWPSFQLLLDVLKAGPLELWSAKPEYSQTLHQALEAVTQASGNLFSAFDGLELERDIIQHGKSVVIDMPNLQPAFLRQFVIDLLITQVLTSRIHRKYKVDKLDVLFVIDEADQDVSRQADERFADGLSPIGQVLKQGRELGVAAILGLSSLNNASPFVLNNATYHLIHSMPDTESVTEAARTLMLPRGAEQILPGLRPGQCLFRQAQSCWPHPMLVQVDYLPPCRTPKTSGFDTHPFVPAKRLAELCEVQRALREKISAFRAGELHRHARPQHKLPESARTLLDLAALYPFTPVARLWDKVQRRSGSVQHSARCDLEQRSLAEFDEVRIGKTKILLVGITAAGWKLLAKRPPSRSGRGSLAHTHIAHWIADVGRKRGFSSPL